MQPQPAVKNDSQHGRTPNIPYIAGWVLTGLVTVAMLASATMKFLQPPDVVSMFVDKFGYPQSILVGIGVIEVCCALLYVIAPTAFLGAILLTGYLGGAVATHVRVGDPFIAPVLLGVVAWAALYLRNRRLRALVPVVKQNAL